MKKSKLKLKKPETYTTLVVSTGHMSLEDSKKLDVLGKDKATGSPECPLVELYEYGYRVYTGGEDSPDQYVFPEYTQAFNDIVRYARRKGHRWVEFDSDGPVYDALPLFDW